MSGFFASHNALIDFLAMRSYSILSGFRGTFYAPFLVQCARKYYEHLTYFY
jgi:hypothetical protein